MKKITYSTIFKKKKLIAFDDRKLLQCNYTKYIANLGEADASYARLKRKSNPLSRKKNKKKRSSFSTVRKCKIEPQDHVWPLRLQIKNTSIKYTVTKS